MRALPVGPTRAARRCFLIAATANVAIGTLVAAGLTTIGLPVIGAITFGLAMTCTGIAFDGITAATAQIAATARAASGIAGAILAMSFVVHGIGDVGDGTLSWLSPLGWAQQARPFAGDQQPRTCLLLVVLGGLAVASACTLLDRRDLGTALVAPRPGPPNAARSLTSPSALARRLQRAATAWWLVGIGALGANGMVAYVADSKEGPGEDVVGPRRLEVRTSGRPDP